MADFANCDYNTFVRSGDEYDFRIDKFLDKFYETNGKKNKFLTDVGLVHVFEIRIPKDLRNMFLIRTQERLKTKRFY